MDRLLKRAKELQEELVAARRYLHANAETGFSLPKTLAYIEKPVRSKPERLMYLKIKTNRFHNL
jgi:metal-dependent amidase/aminoacylase/carboxypeptidase family protein